MSKIRKAFLVGLAIMVVQLSVPGPASARWGFGAKPKPTAVKTNPRAGHKARKPLLRRIFSRRNLKRAAVGVVAGAVALTPVLASAAPVQIQDGRSHVAYGEMIRGRDGQPQIIAGVRGAGNIVLMDESGAHIRSPIRPFAGQEQAQVKISQRQLERAGLNVRVLGKGNPEIIRHLPGRVDTGDLSVTIRGRTLEGAQIFSYRGNINGAALKLNGDVLGTVAGRTAEGINIFSGVGQPAFVSTGGAVNR